MSTLRERTLQKPFCHPSPRGTRLRRTEKESGVAPPDAGGYIVRAMPRPVTPFVGCDVFVTDARARVLLVRRRDNGFWALPGGCQDLGETPLECARRECREETGFEVAVGRLIGVFSSRRYAYVNYPWKDNEFTHLLFAGEITGGRATPSAETSAVAFFVEEDLPPLSDGHAPRVLVGYRALREGNFPPHFE